MKAIHAIYENGVFRPIEPVDLPDGSSVVLLQEDDDDLALLSTHQRRIYALLGQSYDTGDPSLAERHNEHQP